jgi:hypothetical protein
MNVFTGAWTSEESRLLEKLRRIEALLARPGTEGERVAAARARDRIIAALRELKQKRDLKELRFTVPDEWSRRLLLAVLRRHGIRPYRKRRQRRTTVMARVSESFARNTIMPEFAALQAELNRHFDAVTSRIIVQTIRCYSSEVG